MSASEYDLLSSEVSTWKSMPSSSPSFVAGVDEVTDAAVDDDWLEPAELELLVLRALSRSAMAAAAAADGGWSRRSATVRPCLRRPGGRSPPLPFKD